ncbi:MAG: FecR domain-containing protein [Bacteroidota bacterium]
MNQQQLEQIDIWMADQSFRAWSLREGGEAAADWEKWLLENPDQLALAEVAAQMVRGIPFKKIETNDEAAEQSLTALFERMQKEKADVIQFELTEPRNINWSRISLGIAASIALFIALFLGFYGEQEGQDQIYATTFGEQKTFVLPDQSTVTLNANSSLRFNKSNSRLVHLKGEAFFKVKKNQGKRFQVITEDLEVEVLGTSFNVNTHREATRVFLEEGSVKLKLDQEAADTVRMVPGDLLSYSAERDSILTNTKVNAESITAWRNGSIKFENVRVAEILLRMEEIYGLKIELSDSTQQIRILNLTIPSDDQAIAVATLEEVMGMQTKFVKKDSMIMQ